MLFSSAPVVDVHTNCLTTSHRIDLATKRLTVKPRAPNPYHAAARRARDSEDEPIPPARSPKGSASLSHSRASIHSKDFHDADVSPQIADFRGYWRLPRPRSHLRWAARRLGVDGERRGTACGHRGRTEARARAERQPGHARATVSADPLVTAVEMVDVPGPPAVRLTVFGEALIEKSFRSFTVKVSCVECMTLPSPPVTVSVYVPGAAVPVPIVSVEEPRAVTEAGSKLALAPDGTPEMVRSIAPGEPLTTAVEMVDVAKSPCATLMVLGEALIEKSFGCTVSASAAQ